MLPQTSSINFRETVKDDLLKDLFFDQNLYWHTKLYHLSQQNALHYGRRKGPFGIHYLGKNWKGYTKGIDWADSSYSFLPLHLKYPDSEKTMLRLIAEISELDTEKYEADRFLAGLLLFPAPLEIFAEVLGSRLHNISSKILKRHRIDIENSTSWDLNSQRALDTYTNAHIYIVKAMNERLVINLITQEQLNNTN